MIYHQSWWLNQTKGYFFSKSRKLPIFPGTWIVRMNHGDTKVIKLDDQKTHPILERMLRTIQGDATKQDPSSTSSKGRQHYTDHGWWQIPIDKARGSGGHQGVPLDGPDVSMEIFHLQATKNSWTTLSWCITWCWKSEVSGAARLFQKALVASLLPGARCRWLEATMQYSHVIYIIVHIYIYIYRYNYMYIYI